MTTEEEVEWWAPMLAYHNGRKHAAWGWPRRYGANWHQKQKDAYDRGWKETVNGRGS